MSIRTTLFTASVVLCLAATAAARLTDSQRPDYVLVLDGSPVHNVGELRLHMSNWGGFGSWPGSGLPFSAAPSGEWPAGSGIEHVFTGGLWVGALKGGVPAVSQAAYPFEFRPTSSPVDIVYYSAQGAPGGTRFPFPGADDDQDGATDEEFLDGHDNDLDGAIDEDFAAISDQMLSRWYTDDQPEAVAAYPQHNPLGITVRERSYQWDNDDYDDFVGIDYEITNTGDTLLEDVYIGVFFDGDVGDRDVPNYYENDVTAFRRVTVCTEYGGVKLDYGYMADELIGSGLAVLLLDHPTDPNGEPAPTTVHWSTFAAFSGSASYEDGGDPTNDFERYELMSSQTIERDPVVPADLRILLSAGPFNELAPGATINFSVALVGFRLDDGSNIRNAAIAYRGRWLNADEDPNTGVEGRETPVLGPVENLVVDACRPPFDQPINIGRTTVWVNTDCEQEEQYRDLCFYTDPEQYATGVNGNEYHAHWILPGDEIPTPVAIQRFDARSDGRAVHLAWEIWADEGIAAFDILRAEGSGDLLPLESVDGSRREYIDRTVRPGTRYEYQLIAREADDGMAVSQRVSAVVPRAAPALSPNTPNPFATVTTMAFTLPERTDVELAVYDVTGRRVAMVFAGEKDAGDHEVEWSGRSDDGQLVGSGVYFLRMQAGKHALTRKMLVMR